jgi:hypothetical protein
MDQEELDGIEMCFEEDSSGLNTWLKTQHRKHCGLLDQAQCNNSQTRSYALDCMVINGCAIRFPRETI